MEYTGSLLLNLGSDRGRLVCLSFTAVEGMSSDVTLESGARGIIESTSSDRDGDTITICYQLLQADLGTMELSIGDSTTSLRLTR